jgi:hypothetical protein
VVLHPLHCAARDSGFRRRVGHTAQHDRGLVNKSEAVGGHRKCAMTKRPIHYNRKEYVLRDPLYQRSAGHELTERRHLLLRALSP